MPKVGELILVAAPSCCGKTRFLNELFAGRLHHVLTAMKIKAPIDSYQSVIPQEIADIDSSNVPRMILHYALPTIALDEGSLRNLEDDPRLEIVSNSERVTVLTLITSPAILTSRLLARNRAHRILLLTNFSKYFRERRRLGRLKDLYAEPSRIKSVFDAWFAYSSLLPNLADQWLITADDEYGVYAQRDWLSISKSYFVDSKGN